MKEVMSTPGLVQWFHLNQFREVEKALADFQKLGIKRIRTNISWADWHSADGKAWLDWLFATLGGELEILPCILYTPPSLGIQPKTSSPPVVARAYADFVDTIITEYGHYFDYVELWNEPNNQAEYDFTLDPHWDVFCEMVGAAANWCRKRGKKTVLGGMSPIDPNWLREMFRKGLMEYIDVVGIHGFPDVFDYNWEGWDRSLEKVRAILGAHHSHAEVWITEAGFSTWQKNERRQVKEFINVCKASVSRLYWYALADLPAELPAVDRYHLDEREYHFGMKNQDGSPKLLYTLLGDYGLQQVVDFEWLTQPTGSFRSRETTPYTLITGGAGFVGTNLADRILSSGKPVVVFDNLSRPGVINNLLWLREKHPDRLRVVVGDIRDKRLLGQVVTNASEVYHFAAQVAVTSSLVNPFADFEVNASGTLNLLEAVRATEHQPPVIFTSTNKVYGDLQDLSMVAHETRYWPSQELVMHQGINEDRTLDFHSPYGCSKGVADQYVLDYARTFGLQTVVFRMSCIYGPHQFGTEDQGWVAHFILQALKNQPITFYGDGRQVRDILYVDDLVDAFLLARENIDRVSGKAYNIGGGITNTVSLMELMDSIHLISGEKPEVRISEWRASDQKYYVSDTGKFRAVTGWSPITSPFEGITRLYDWLIENNAAFRITTESRMIYSTIKNKN